MVGLQWCTPPKKNPGSAPATVQEFIIPSGIEKVKPQTLRKQPRDMWLVNEGLKCNRRITVFIFLIFSTKLNIYHLFSMKYVLASKHTIVPKMESFFFLTMFQDRDVFDSKKKVKATSADGLEHKLTAAQQKSLLFNRCLLSFYSNQVRKSLPRFKF